MDKSDSDIALNREETQFCCQNHNDSHCVPMNHCHWGPSFEMIYTFFLTVTSCAKWALNYLTVPSGYLFILNAHVLGRTFIPCVYGTKLQQSKSFARVFNLTLIAFQNLAWKGPLVAVSYNGLSLLYFEEAIIAASRRGSISSEIFEAPFDSHKPRIIFESRPCR